MREVGANLVGAKEAKSIRTPPRGHSEKAPHLSDLRRWLFDYLLEGVTQRFGFAGMEAGNECVDVLYGQMRHRFRSQQAASLAKLRSFD